MYGSFKLSNKIIQRRVDMRCQILIERKEQRCSPRSQSRVEDSSPIQMLIESLIDDRSCRDNSCADSSLKKFQKSPLGWGKRQISTRPLENGQKIEGIARTLAGNMMSWERFMD